jgi:hypothetical protein
MSGAQLALRRSHFPGAVEIGARVARKLAYVRWCEGAPRANSALHSSIHDVRPGPPKPVGRASGDPLFENFHVRSELLPTALKVLYRGL